MKRLDLEPIPVEFRFADFDRLPDPPDPKKCIGCGRYLRKDAHWNQCADCDTRTPEDFA